MFAAVCAVKSVIDEVLGGVAEKAKVALKPQIIGCFELMALFGLQELVKA
jgi:hypothetical protein